MDVLPILREGNRGGRSVLPTMWRKADQHFCAEAPDDVTSYMVQPMQAELEDVAIDLKYKRTFGIFAIILSLCWMADLLTYFIWPTNLFLITVEFFLMFVFVILSILLLSGQARGKVTGLVAIPILLLSLFLVISSIYSLTQTDLDRYFDYPHILLIILFDFLFRAFTLAFSVGLVIFSFVIKNSPFPSKKREEELTSTHNPKPLGRLISSAFSLAASVSIVSMWVRWAPACFIC